MYDAAAATEVVCYASRKLVANAMHCRQQATDPKGMRLDRYLCCIVVVSVGNRQNESDDSWNTRKSVSLSFRPWMAESGFPSLSAKQLVKSASTFLSAFRLLPRLEEVYIPWVYTPAATERGSQ